MAVRMMTLNRDLIKIINIKLIRLGTPSFISQEFFTSLVDDMMAVNYGGFKVFLKKIAPENLQGFSK